MTENTRKNAKNTFKKGHKMVKIQNFEKLLKMCLDIDLKIIFSKHYVPGSKCVTCSSFTDRKYQKNVKKYLKNAIKWSKIKILKNYLKLSRYRPKDNIFKTSCSYAKNYVHEVNNSLKSSKMALKSSKIFFFFFALSMS